MGNRRGLFGFPRPVFLSGWRIPARVILSVLFVAIRCLAEMSFANFVGRWPESLPIKCQAGFYRYEPLSSFGGLGKSVIATI